MDVIDRSEFWNIRFLNEIVFILKVFQGFNFFFTIIYDSNMLQGMEADMLLYE